MTAQEKRESQLAQNEIYLRLLITQIENMVDKEMDQKHITVEVSINFLQPIMKHFSELGYTLNTNHHAPIGYYNLIINW